MDITFDGGLVNGYDEKRLMPGGLFRASGVMYLPNDPSQLYKLPGRKKIIGLLSATQLTAVADEDHSIAAARYVGSDTNIIAYTDPYGSILRTYQINAVLSAGQLSSGSLCSTTTTSSYANCGDSLSTAFEWLCGFVKAVPTGDNRWVFFNGDPGSRPLVRDKYARWYYLGLNAPTATISDPALSSGISATIRPSSASSYATSGTNAYPYLSEEDWHSETFLGEVLHIPASAWNYALGTSDGDVAGTSKGVKVHYVTTYLGSTSEAQLSACFGIYPMYKYWDRHMCSAFSDLSNAWDSSVDTYARVTFPRRSDSLEPNTPDVSDVQIERAGSVWLESKGKTNGTHVDTKWSGKKEKRFNSIWWAAKDQDDDISNHKQFRVASATWEFTSADVASEHTLYVTIGSTIPIQGDSTKTKSKAFVHVSTDSGTSWISLGGALAPLTADQTFTYIVPSGTTFSNIRVKVTLVVRKINVSTSVDLTVNDIRIDAGVEAFVDSGNYTYAITEVFRYTDADGRTYETESAPSNQINADIAAGTVNTATINLPAAPANTSAHGVHASHFYRIYRSTSTGGWPDLGYLASANISGGSFTDDFSLDGSTLGSPPLPLVYLGLAAYPACVKPPNFRDACLFRGSIVAIPANDPTKIIWSVPGRVYAFPVPYSLKVMPDNRNDELMGVATVNDALILFGRNRVLRLLSLPFTANPNYEENRVSVDTISLTEGIQNPLNYCLAYLEDGTHIIAFASRTGIYATDGSVAGEGGTGLRKLTPHIDWTGMIEPSRLANARLFYDPNTQTIRFDYDPKDYAEGSRL